MKLRFEHLLHVVRVAGRIYEKYTDCVKAHYVEFAHNRWINPDYQTARFLISNDFSVKDAGTKPLKGRVTVELKLSNFA